MKETIEIKKCKIRKETTEECLKNEFLILSNAQNICLSFKKLKLEQLILKAILDYIVSQKSLKSLEIKIGEFSHFEQNFLSELVCSVNNQSNIQSIAIKLKQGSCFQQDSYLPLRIEIQNFLNLQSLELSLNLKNNILQRKQVSDTTDWFQGLNMLKSLKITLFHLKENHEILKELSNGYQHFECLENFSLCLRKCQISFEMSAFLIGSYLKKKNTLKSLALIFKKSFWNNKTKGNILRNKDVIDYLLDLQQDNGCQWDDIFVSIISLSIKDLTHLSSLVLKLANTLDQNTYLSLLKTFSNMDNVIQLQLKLKFNQNIQIRKDNYEFLLSPFQQLKSLSSFHLSLATPISLVLIIKYLNILKKCPHLQKLSFNLSQFNIKGKVEEVDYLSARQFLQQLACLKIKLKYCLIREIIDEDKVLIFNGLPSLQKFISLTSSPFQFNPKIKQIQLKNWVQNQNSLQHLELSLDQCNNQTESYQFFKEIGENKCLQYLKIQTQHIFFLSIQDIQAFGESLSKLNQLTKLDLNLQFKNNEGVEDVNMFQKSFQCLPLLQHLTLYFDDKCNVSIIKIETFLKNLLSLTNLKSLNIQLSQEILSERGLSILTNLIQQNSRLKHQICCQTLKLNIQISKKNLRELKLRTYRLKLCQDGILFVKNKLLNLVNLKRLHLLFFNNQNQFEYPQLFQDLPSLENIVFQFSILKIKRFGSILCTKDIGQFFKNKYQFEIIQLSLPKVSFEQEQDLDKYQQIFSNLKNIAFMDVSITHYYGPLNKICRIQLLKMFLQLQNIKTLKIHYLELYYNPNDQDILKRILKKLPRLVIYDILHY